jgi:signal transduction histidine kinase
VALERVAIARDLHDDLAQLPSVAQLKLAALAEDAGGTKGKARLRELNEVVDRAAAAVRSLAKQLDPPLLAELGLVPALDWPAEEVERDYGLSITTHDDGVAKPLTQEKRSILFRAVRELIINVARHAQTGRAELAVSVRAGRLVLVLADDGVGFDSAQLAKSRRGSRGLGPRNVRERARLVEGSFKIVSAPGNGTTATLSVPLDEAPDDASSSSNT